MKGDLWLGKYTCQKGDGNSGSLAERQAVFAGATGRKDACWCVLQCLIVAWVISFSFGWSTAQ